jgi:hypothetical protein
MVIFRGSGKPTDSGACCPTTYRNPTTIVRLNQVNHGYPVIQLISASDGSARRDTHIPIVDRGKNTIKSDGGSSVDSEVLTHLVGGADDDRIEVGGHTSKVAVTGDFYVKFAVPLVFGEL